MCHQKGVSVKGLQQWIEPFIGHNLAYNFLGGAFYDAPDAGLIGTIARENLFEDWTLPCTNAAMEHGLDTLRQFTKGWQDTQLPALKRDYDRLFVGPGKLLAVPWESVYRSQEGLIFEQQTVAVRQFYRRFAMAVPKPGIEPEDHIGLELRFVAHLYALGLQAVEHGQENSFDLILGGLAQFFEVHLGQWAEACFDRVRQHAQTPYYRGVAQLASGCLVHSMMLLGVNAEAATV